MEAVFSEIRSMKIKRNFFKVADDGVYSSVLYWVGQAWDRHLILYRPSWQYRTTFYLENHDLDFTDSDQYDYTEALSEIRVMPCVKNNTFLKSIYHTTSSFCTCPDFRFRQKKLKSKCKHMKNLDQEHEIMKLGLSIGELGIGPSIVKFTGINEKPVNPKCSKERCRYKSSYKCNGNFYCKVHVPKIEHESYDKRCDYSCCYFMGKVKDVNGKSWCRKHIPVSENAEKI